MVTLAYSAVFSYVYTYWFSNGLFKQCVMMAEAESVNLEEQCEDAVFQISCTRERYSARCAKYLEKYLALVRKKQTAKVQTNPVPNFDKPVITERQEKLYDDFTTDRKTQQSTAKTDPRETLNRIKELKSILNQIERSSKTEIQQFLKE